MSEPLDTDVPNPLLDAGAQGEPASPTSALSPKEYAALISDEAMFAQMSQFVDDCHYRVMTSSMGKGWNRYKVVETCLEALALSGVPLTEQEITKLARVDERHMIGHVVEQMDDEFRENFHELAHELMTFMETACHLRSAADSGNDEEVIQAIDQSESSRIGQQVLQCSVLQAAREVAHLHRCHETWVKNMETRLDRLMHSAEAAEDAQRRLMAVEAQLSSFGDEQNAKSKKVLMSFVEGNKQALVQASFAAWQGLYIQNLGERQLRQRFEQEIADAEKTLFALQEKQLASVKGILMHQAEGASRHILEQTLEQWKREVQVLKADRKAEEDLKTVQGKLGACAKEQADKAMSVMARMGTENEAELVGIVFAGWLKFNADCNKDKEFEDAVKRAEVQLKAHMEKKKEEAKAVLDRMANSTDTGLLGGTFTAWLNFITEGKKFLDLERKMTTAGCKFQNLKMRQKGNVTGVNSRANELINLNLLLRVLSAWHLETKVNRVDKYFNMKVDSKRKQLSAVQTLFKSFAQDLEEGLKHVDGDSSGRGTGRRHHSRQMTRDGHAVSLPDIHAR
eukprot:gb/GFBE01029488.1/.p1 GENE.gb/GFBE01029488.1/~~gb/GFBE01029488.1/.p1  ORF type:complete len:567 (+),score=173.60 gb/GFBE01029488.1/:1-1701(+)